MLATSIQAGLDNREEALEYAMQFGRGLDSELADRFVGMYVNELTCDYGDEGRQAVRELLRRAEALGVYEPSRQGRVRRLSHDRGPARLPAALDGGAHGGAGGRRAHLEEAGVSGEQFALLSLIATVEPITPTALAAEMGVPLTTLADALRRLDGARRDASACRTRPTSARI